LLIKDVITVSAWTTLTTWRQAIREVQPSLIVNVQIDMQKFTNLVTKCHQEATWCDCSSNLL